MKTFKRAPREYRNITQIITFKEPRPTLTHPHLYSELLKQERTTRYLFKNMGICICEKILII